MPGVPVHVYQVFQLTEGDYSQPLGSLGIIMRMVGTNACEVQWLTGSYSLPVLTEHLTVVGTFALPIEPPAPDLITAIERMLRDGHKFWEAHQHSPDSDKMSAALTDLHMALNRHASP